MILMIITSKKNLDSDITDLMRKDVSEGGRLVGKMLVIDPKHSIDFNDANNDNLKGTMTQIFFWQK